MKKIGWIVMMLGGAVAGFVIGASLGKPEEQDVGLRQRPTEMKEKEREPDRVPILLDSLESYRKEIAEKEDKIGDLRTRLDEAREKLPPPLSAEEERRKKEEEERTKRDERRKARDKQVEELRKKILQRKDKVLRALGLEELAALLQSDDPKELALGLATLPRLSGINLDMERFKPVVLAALENEDAEVRLESLKCALRGSPTEDQLEFLLRMTGDPSSEIRGYAIARVTSVGGKERDERIATVLAALLHDEDKNVRTQTLFALRGPYAKEMEDMVIELARDPDMAGSARYWLMETGELSGKAAQRLIEITQEKASGLPTMFAVYQFRESSFSEEARPIVAMFYARVVRDSLDRRARHFALEGLQGMGDVSVLPELEKIARGPDAEGIEDELAKTIESLQKRANQTR